MNDPKLAEQEAEDFDQEAGFVGEDTGCECVETATLASLRAAGQAGILRKFMDPEEIKAANALVKKGKAVKGASADKQGSVVYFAEDRISGFSGFGPDCPD